MPRQRNKGQYGCPTYNQASKVIARFGGEAKLAKLIGVSRITLYRWNYKRPLGSDGLIPTAQIERIRSCARLEGVLLRPEDWVPERNQWDENQQIAQQTRTRRSLADLLT